MDTQVELSLEHQSMLVFGSFPRKLYRRAERACWEEQRDDTFFPSTWPDFIKLLKKQNP